MLSQAFQWFLQPSKATLVQESCNIEVLGL